MIATKHVRGHRDRRDPRRPAAGATVPVGGDPAAVPPVPAADPAAPGASPAETDLLPGMHATAPVTVRPAPRMPRRGPLTVMGPWAPVAGGLLGLLLGVVAVLVLGGSAEVFEDRLALAFLVLGLGMLGTSGILLATRSRCSVSGPGTPPSARSGWR